MAVSIPRACATQQRHFCLVRGNAKVEVMTSVSRFPDWSSLSARKRLAALEQCRQRLAGIGLRLKAVEHIYPAEALRPGPLFGLPYVAKDMFATGRSQPSWGCTTPQAPALPRASVIDRLDQAGASLI